LYALSYDISYGLARCRLESRRIENTPDLEHLPADFRRSNQNPQKQGLLLRTLSLLLRIPQPFLLLLRELLNLQERDLEPLYHLLKPLCLLLKLLLIQLYLNLLYLIRLLGTTESLYETNLLFPRTYYLDSILYLTKTLYTRYLSAPNNYYRSV
jgi:hypothetical protein